MNLGRPDRSNRLDALAAAYALGTLSFAARRRLAGQALRDPAVSTAIRAWEWRLAALADGIPPVLPPPRVWERIQARLGLAGSGTPATSRSRAPMVVEPRLVARIRRRRLRAGLRPRDRPAVAHRRAPIRKRGRGAGRAGCETGAHRDGRARQSLPDGEGGWDVTIARDRSLELWLLPDGRPPQSLGLVPASGIERVALRAPAGVALEGIPALAVSPGARGRLDYWGAHGTRALHRPDRADVLTCARNPG
jgi:anti-sigma-K factor RskA